MNLMFRETVESLEPKFQQLINSAPVTYARLPQAIPERGIYLFSEGDIHLYVGRTNHLRNRLRGHCSTSSTHLTAAFAFRIARQETGQLRASYKKEGSRAALMQDETFAAAFRAAKQRLLNMHIRYVEEVDPVRQTLLEVYAAVILKTPFNDFDNH
jgi:predicted GIY-YIG superfamily endonuclease